MILLSKWRETLFPIYTHELSRFIPMALMMVCILFNYTVLRATKDALIATSPVAGVEAIPYLKSIFVMSVSAIFVIAYTKISNIFSFRSIYIGCNLIFIVFFIAFAFIFFPYQEVLHPDREGISFLQENYVRIKYLFSVWGVWTYSIFYVMAEMWGNIMIPLLFWQFANQTTSLEEAKRFYPMFILLGNMALILSGTALQYFCEENDSLIRGVESWGASLKGLMLLTSVMALLSIISYLYASSSKRESASSHQFESKPKEKNTFKMGILESFKYIFSNRYIAFIAILILSYSISINLVELTWKKQIALWFQNDSSGYTTYMGRYVTLTGIATIIIAFATKGIIKKYGWLTGAITTPFALFISGLVFFTIILAQDLLGPLLTLISLPATYLAMEVGLFQSIFTRGIKYTLFDTSKEMAYIPLDDELKAKGKAVVDIMGARLGKTFGSWIVLLLFYILSVQDVMEILPYLACIILSVICIWLVVVFKINNLYMAMTERLSNVSKPVSKEVDQGESAYSHG